MTDISGLPPAALDGRGITAHIASQYHQGIPYCTISTRALVAVNTFAPMDVNQDQVFRNLAAHVCNRMELRGESQTVCFLGEHGSGKSEFSAAFTRHVLTLAGNPLSSRIRNVQPILEALGTAKTASSVYASKLGLLTELQYDRESALVGAAIFDYRLDRQRVTKIPTNERNYHVFYFMVNGLSDEERYHLQLNDVASTRYRYLGHPSQLRLTGVDDKIKFKQLKSALYALGFSRADVANIFQVLAAIIHLGQVQFRTSNMDSSVAQTTAVEIANPDIIELVSSFLGVMPDVLTACLVSKTVMINKDRVTVVLDQKGARENADEVARTLYTLLFSWILERINNELSRNGPDASAGDYDPLIQTTLSIVDFPGFNTSATPALDRLLHNTANEMLYNYMMHSYFTRPDDVLGREDVEIPTTEYFDNTDTIRTLTRPNLGLLSVINDYAQRDKDESQLVESLSRRFQSSNTVNVHRDTRSFVVNHFDGEVDYSIKGLLDDSKESISCDIINLFNSSTSSNFLKDVFSKAAVVTDRFGTTGTVVGAALSSEPRRQPSLIRDSSNALGRRGSQRYSAANEQRRQGTYRGKDVSSTDAKKMKGSASQFVLAVDKMLEAVDENNAYFVLCIKPNDHKLVSSLDARCVRQQVTGLGIPELAKRTKLTDLSIFLPFNEYIRLSGTDLQPEVGESERSFALRLLSTFGWPERDARAGTTGVFLSESAWISLVDPSYSFAERAAKKYAANVEDKYKEAYMYQDLETKSLAGGFGNMFRFAGDPRHKDEYIHVNDEDDMKDVEDLTAPPRTSRQRKLWLTIVWLYTFWVPEFFIKHLSGMSIKSKRIAWREKFAINLIIWGMCAGCILFLIGFPYLVCPLQDVMSAGELSGYSSQSSTKVYTAIRGIVFDITKFGDAHYPSIVSNTEILGYGGTDSSDLFPMQISAVCGGVNGSMSEFIVLGDPTNYTDVNAQYHDFRSFTNDSRPDWYLDKMEFFNKNYRKSYIGYTPKDVTKMVSSKRRVVASLDNYVYDVTDYVNGNIYTKAPAGYVAPDVDTQFMDADLMDLFQNYAGQDITKHWKKLGVSDDVRENMNRCLRNVFMIGKVDSRGSVRCLFARYFLLAVTCFVVLVVLIKFLAALQFGSYEYPDDLDRFVICQVPVYTEDETSLRRAIDSLARTKYDDKRKLLVVICDGMIRGHGNEETTPQMVLNILGGSEGQDPPALPLEGLGEGEQQYNMGKIYYGVYEVGGHLVPYLVLVKVGKPTEMFRPGNRGKRDSQMVVMRFLNRVHYNAPMSPFELELYRHFEFTVGVSPAYYEYLMQVDADTVVSQESLSQLVGKMVLDNRIQAICGETALSNSRHSLVTMIQVYEYYISHNLAKAFESLFGSVTCLPGCFSLYRLYEQRTAKPVFVSTPVVESYAENTVRTLHDKNLLHLGEDRYLTTLLLKYNSQYTTKYLRHAHAFTIAPDSWSVFLSQRRRWINSTVHNLVELVPMGQLCGFCCFSMRFMVILDLFSTLIQPVTCAYLAYLIYLCVDRTDSIPITSIVMVAAIYGLQAIIFVLRRKWEMIGWMIVYIFALPIFSLALPLYSFWYMDDFSWGSTRMVFGEKGQRALIADEGNFDAADIPLRTWSDYKSEMENRDNREKYDVDLDAQSVMLSNRQSMSAMSLAPSSRAQSMVLADEQDMSNQPTDADLTEAIREILATADLTKITKRSVRAELERQFGCKLNMRKEYISRATEALLMGEL